MNNRVLIILLSAFFIALGCSYLVYRLVGNRLNARQPTTTAMVVAARDIPLGSVLHVEDLGTAQMTGPLPKGAIVNTQDAVGRGVVSTLDRKSTRLNSSH